LTWAIFDWSYTLLGDIIVGGIIDELLLTEAILGLTINEIGGQNWTNSLEIVNHKTYWLNGKISAGALVSNYKLEMGKAQAFLI
jgi:hypothetical protein